MNRPDADGDTDFLEIFSTFYEMSLLFGVFIDLFWLGNM